MSSKKSGKSVPPPEDGSTLTSFEQQLAELEEIVRQLEAGEKPLDESLGLYERGVAALKACHAVLNRAEKRIRVLVKDADGAPHLEDEALDGGSFEAGAETPKPPGRKRRNADEAADVAEEEEDAAAEDETEAPSAERGTRRRAGRAAPLEGGPAAEGASLFGGP